MNQIDVSFNMSSILALVMAFSFFGIMYYSTMLAKIKKLTNIVTTAGDTTKIKKKSNKGYINGFKNELRKYLIFNNKEKLLPVIFNTFILLLIGLFILFVELGNIMLAIVIPMLIYCLTFKVVQELITEPDYIIRQDLPVLINHMVKSFSKTNDLSTVLYESSRELKSPLKKMILDLSRRMIANNSEKTLVDFAEAVDNMWIYSFIFLLVNYKENSSKENIVQNLLSLSKMIESRHELSVKMISDRKPVVIMNTIVLIAGIILFVGNITINPMALRFMVHSIEGNICLIGGIASIYATIIINLKLSKE